MELGRMMIIFLGVASITFVCMTGLVYGIERILEGTRQKKPKRRRK